MALEQSNGEYVQKIFTY